MTTGVTLQRGIPASLRAQAAALYAAAFGPKIALAVPDPDQRTRLLTAALLLDGIAVSSTQRGRGIGSMLLTELKQYAREQGYTTIRLDVIDTNPGARRLYQRHGFNATETQQFGFLRRWLGFGAATTMIFTLADEG